MPAAPEAAPPGGLASNTKIYLRPQGLTGGQAAEALVAAGAARPLAGGPLAFTACTVTLSGPEGLHRWCAPLAAVEAWAERLPPAAAAGVFVRLALLVAPRLSPGGGRLERPLVMGVINVTPDSFSDGGRFLDPAAALAHGRRLAAAGADILDVGGESVRPGAEPVNPGQESARIGPVLDGLGSSGCLLSVDTRHAGVMSEALARGAGMINDVSALAGDPGSLAVAAASEATVVLMHMRGEPATMNQDPRYADVACEVFDFLEARVAACQAAGIPRHRIIVDPGLGFGKRGQHNLMILREISLYHGLGCPVMIGVSRKGLTGALDRARAPAERLPGSLAGALWAAERGVQIFRVHDVAETRQALDVGRAIALRGA